MKKIKDGRIKRIYYQSIKDIKDKNYILYFWTVVGKVDKMFNALNKYNLKYRSIRIPFLNKAEEKKQKVCGIFSRGKSCNYAWKNIYVIKDGKIYKEKNENCYYSGIISAYK